nr:MAG TPA: hypothetical protein [Caudoviricetes sp.]
MNQYLILYSIKILPQNVNRTTKFLLTFYLKNNIILL